MTNQAENPVTGTVAVTRQHERCRKHVKTRADQTEKHTFSRSRYTAFSRSRAAGGLGSEARQGGFHGRPQRSDRRIQRRGDARVHERNREIASAVQEKKKEMGHRRSYREQQPRWWC